MNVTTITLAGCLGLIGASAYADDGSEAKEKWHYSLTPYIWAAGISGSIRSPQLPSTLHFNESISDVLKSSQGAFFVTGSARQDRFIVIADVLYSDLSRSGSLAPGVSARGGVRRTSVTVTAGYRAVDSKTGYLDVLTGFRHTDQRSSVDVPAMGLSISSNQRTTDMVLAAQGTERLGPKWSFTIYGDMGIFRLGARSTYQLLATVNYELKDDVFLSLGYRELSADVSKDGNRVDTRLSGPVAGVTWRF